VGRQPIYDRTGDVIAYELLFRDAAEATRATRRSADATGRVIVAAFTEFGLDRLAGDRACFINVTRDFLVGDMPVPFVPDQSVLEIVETVDVDDAVIDGVRDLVQRGFTIALDDFTLGAHERLLEYATYVKIDLLGVDPAVVARAVRQCRRSAHVQLIAERLETPEDLQRAMDLGFDFFQGHVLGQPHVVSTTSLSPARVSRLRLLVALTAADVDFDEVVRLVAGDPALSYRLLQATNSAASGLATRVSSVREAAVLLGMDTVRHWVILMLTSDLAEASPEQLAVALTRAWACRTVALQLDRPADAAFTVGLLSGIAQLTAQAPADLAAALPLAPEVGAALADHEGPLGEVLRVVRAYEEGDPHRLANLLGSIDAVRAYLSAVEWSTAVVRGVDPAGSGRAAPIDA
jgi:EAL and modified HD-GYP domain-containing signal transduction protein